MTDYSRGYLWLSSTHAHRSVRGGASDQDRPIVRSLLGWINNREALPNGSPRWLAGWLVDLSLLQTWSRVSLPLVDRRF